MMLLFQVNMRNSCFPELHSQSTCFCLYMQDHSLRKEMRVNGGNNRKKEARERQRKREAGENQTGGGWGALPNRFLIQ